MQLPSSLCTVVFEGKVDVIFLQSANKCAENLQQKHLQLWCLVVSNNGNVINNNCGAEIYAQVKLPSFVKYIYSHLERNQEDPLQH